MDQKIFIDENFFNDLEKIFTELKSKKVFVVVDKSYSFLSIKKDIELFEDRLIFFDKFTSNPVYEDVCKGVELFNSSKCDCILAIGGGSSIDVAKCIKLFSKMNKEEIFLEQVFNDTQIPLIVVPTTAGTGSESTKHAVIYYEGKKQSISHESIIPNFVILNSSVLKTLPIYQKKCTMLDALCQGIESWWSVNSTDESKEYSKNAVTKIMNNYKNYIFNNDSSAAKEIMIAANLSGKAINITQTTAPHAMSYKITSLYKLPHGHAVAICLPYVWEYMYKSLEKCIDYRGKEYLLNVFSEIANIFGKKTILEAIDFLKNMLSSLEINAPITLENLDELVSSVNPIRLKNNPVKLDYNALTEIYTKVLNKEIRK